MKTNRAVTLTEIVVVIAILAAISAPTFLFYKNSVKTSVSGVVNLEILSEGKRIIGEISDDLKNSCIPYQGAFSFAFNDLLISTPSGIYDNTTAEFALYRHAREAKTIRQRGLNSSLLLKPLISVRYNLEKNTNNDFFRLIRTESLIGGSNKIKVLSERICCLEIKPVKIDYEDNRSAWLWNVFVIISHSPDGSFDKSNPGNRAKGTISMEFHDLVSSEFFSAIARHPYAMRNWNSGLTYNPN